MTQQKQFADMLEREGFTVNKDGLIFAHKDIIPHHRIDKDGNHNLIYMLSVVNFEGVDTKEGDLGCVTFAYVGRYRGKGKRTAHDSIEVIKKAFCPKNANDAYRQFLQWQKETATHFFK